MVTGKCLCGQISVTIPRDALNKSESTGICYCKNCRQTGGSLAVIHVFLPETDVKIQGKPKLYQDKNTASGNTLERFFCGDCGSSIYGKTPSMPPGTVAVQAGGLFDQVPKPGICVFSNQRQTWDQPIEGAKDFQPASK